MSHSNVVIVGAGHAGAQCAIALRQNGFTGTITVIGREPEYPYERPPLSKEYFARTKTFERLLIRPAAFWSEKAIAFRLGTTVTAVDPEAHTVTLDDASSLGYDHLVWAAGGDPRALPCPGADRPGVHVIRTRADCDALMAAVEQGIDHVAIIGGGYIGLEAAAVLTKLGLRVTVLEAQERLLARVAGETLSNFYAEEHRRQGVALRTGVTVEALEEADGRVSGVRLAGGEIVPCDAVVVGIGVVPAVAPLRAAGAQGTAGVRVDAACRTSLPDIFAIGDCAEFACAFADGAVLRVESVQNANDMASCVARILCGEERAYHAFPWFWSNQYDLKLQTAGLNIGHDAQVLRGDPEARSFSVVYLKQGRMVAIDCVNRIKDYVQAKALIEAGAHPDPADLADAERPLKELRAPAA